ncbi:hypothetical protein CBR_g26284 [Chara braunii]|uniref:UBA domain-containing protein n=1 Tax=Chara braunii TaxID=69332 RepID=A0A388L7E8_CHABU|nr:hypothetical protein CBR_g26284 [Chara braunii]|eukprot:GBG78251.1 hypothetical protein CBR_g26284 [Chara braunii]
MPMMTSGILAVCVGVYLFDVLVGFDAFDRVCMEPGLMFSAPWELYRGLTSVLFHAGLLHISLNMMTFVPLGSGLERLLGSTRYLYSVFLFAVTNTLIHGGLAYLAAFNPILPYPRMWYECSIGFSGILFSMIVAETYMSGMTQRSIFGFFTVPAQWYPWALLVLFQVIMPNVSILGHLSGLLSGLAFATGVLSIISLPASAISAIESLPCLAPLVRKPTFIVGGSNVAAVGLPGPGASGHEGSGLGFSTMWRRMQGWSQLPSMAPSSADRDHTSSAGQRPTSGPFAGRGHTLGGSVAVPPHRWGAPPQATGSNAAISDWNSAAATAGGIAGAGRGGPVVTVGVPVQQVGGGEARAPALPLTGPALPAAQADNSGSDGVVSSAALAQLVAMGFETSAARSALLAANGDVALAVEFLSP